jgi:predicted GNAT family acetyltransferase
MKEAKYLVRHGLIWVLEVSRAGHDSDIASIVAVTRSSANVSGITKVYTNPRWRKRGCAERLVRHVTRHLLASKVPTVVLYVAHDNAAAAGVYHRVGFRGLGDSKTRVEGVDNWLELGFDRNFVRLGHW